MSLVTTYSGGKLAATAGRVTEIDFGAPVVGVVKDPDGGNATITPNGTLALVLPDPEQRGRSELKVLVDDGSGPREVTVSLDVAPGPVDQGWGAGDHYTLATDRDDRTVVEAGENHRKVYISESKDALSIADIARREGLREGAIDGEWLEAHPEYGASEGMALDTEAGMKLWYQMTGRYTEPASHWLLFEKGYEYAGTGRLIDRGTQGESELHPVLVGTWGSGERPVLEDRWGLFQEKSQNVVLQGLDFAQAGSIVSSGENVILDDVILRDHATVIQKAERITIRDSQILDASEHQKTNGIYVTTSEGILLEKVLADHNGWEDGWEKGDGNAPNALNHNIYIQWSNLDVTFRDSVTMRGSSFGAQIRSGGVIENNAFLDNNIALNIKGGDNSGDYQGNYSLVLDNVVSSAGHRDTPKGGAISWGIQNLAPETSFLGTIIAHLADPADAAERREKTDAPREPLKHKFDAFVDDTIIYNWVSDEKRGHRLFLTDKNVPDIDADLLDEVTLRRFLESVRDGNPGDVTATLADWLRDNWSSIDGGADIVDFFQNGFGIGQNERGAPTDVRFVPDVQGDGMRWDNRLNWSTEDLPIDGDRVDLAGNWVTYSGTTRLASLDLGAGGVLTVRQGRLETADLETGAGSRVEIGLGGQFWTAGYADGEALAVEIEGGRFANTGAFTGPVDLAVSGGEVLLATGGARLLLDGRLAIAGSAAKVGFDGQGGGTAVLSLMPGAELDFTADAGGISAIREFRSGNWGTAAPNVASTIDLGDGDTTLSLDLGLIKVGGGAVTLAAADTLLGGFGAIDVAVAKGVAVTVRIDYATDMVEIEAARSGAGPALVLAGSSGNDVLVVADDIQARIEDYGRTDVIDLSAGLGSADLGKLSLVAAGGEVQLVGSGMGVLATVAGSDLGRLLVRADGWQTSVDGSGAGSPTRVGGGDTPPSTTRNADPVALDDHLRGAADTRLTGSVRATDADGDALTFRLAGGTESGRVQLASDGSFRYNPRGAHDDLPVGETRTERFGFTVSDGRGGSDRGTFSLSLEGRYDPPATEPERNLITGTAGPDVLRGAAGGDLIRSGSGGYDRIWGGDGADVFVFGAGARDGERSSDQIFDFDPAKDIVVLEAGAEIAGMQEESGVLWLTLKGDSDIILVGGQGVDVNSVEIHQTDDVWLG